jgi:hypothetical protein
MKQSIMNTTPEANKRPEGNVTPRPLLYKVATVIGFIGIIIILSFLSVRLVQSFPATVSYLASLADGVYNFRDDEIVLVASSKEIFSGDNTTLSWSSPKRGGTFSLSHPCSDGIRIETADVGGEITVLNCDQIVSLGTTTELTVSIFSDLLHSATIPITIQHFHPVSEKALSENFVRISVTNPTIPSEFFTEQTRDIIPLPPTTPDTTIASSTTVVTPTAPTTKTVAYTVYKIPVSDQSGFTDLEMSYITIGSIVNTQFVPYGSVTQTAKQSAIQFTIKNIGTKTSSSWTYLLRLPDGSVYTSPIQSPLQPNERVTITQGFRTPSIGNYTIVGSIPMNDVHISNNSFTAPFIVR